MMRERFDFYNNLTIHAKAGIWYTFSNLLQKATSFLMIPIMTRLLSVEEYGIYMLYVSWFVILEIIATFRLYSNNFVAGLIRCDKRQEDYIASMQISCLFVVGGIVFVGQFWSKELTTFIDLGEKYLLLMCVSFCTTSIMGIWTARKRVDLHYGVMVKVTLLYSVITPLISLIGAWISNCPLDFFLELKTSLEFIITLPLVASNLNFGRFTFVGRYCEEAIKLSIPLLPYYLSMTILNTSDRIMIKLLIGEAEVAIYSVAYSFSMALFFISGAFTQAIQPWMFSRMKEKKREDYSSIITFSVGFISLFNILFMLILPDVLTLVVPKDYATSLDVMPPLIFSVIVMFIYQQMLNVHFFYAKNIIVFLTSVAGATINVGLNYLFLPSCGYFIAAYTTLVSYILILLVFWRTMILISKKNKFKYDSMFNNKMLLVLLIMDFLFIVATDCLYYNDLARYVVFFMLIILMICNCERLIKLRRFLYNE